MSSIEIKQISSNLTHALRLKILRHGKTVKDVIFPKDNLSSTLHFALYSDSILASIATFQKEDSPLFEFSDQYRLRGMATDENFQSHGFGSKLLKHAINELKGSDCKLLWCNARVGAVEFYKRIGFQTHGTVFDIPDVGPHFKMSYNIL